MEEQEATDPLTEINTAVSEVYMNVIIGNKPIEALDELLQQVKNMGVQKVIDAYQSAYARYQSR